MNVMTKAAMMAAVALSLCACSSIDKLTGQTDDTVLPGQREDAIPGRATFPENSSTAQAPAPQTAAPAPAEPAPAEPACQPDDAPCQPAADDGTFSDPQ